MSRRSMCYRTTPSFVPSQHRAMGTRLTLWFQIHIASNMPSYRAGEQFPWGECLWGLFHTSLELKPKLLWSVPQERTGWFHRILEQHPTSGRKQDPPIKPAKKVEISAVLVRIRLSGQGWWLFHDFSTEKDGKAAFASGESREARRGPHRSRGRNVPWRRRREEWSSMDLGWATWLKWSLLRFSKLQHGARQTKELQAISLQGIEAEEALRIILCTSFKWNKILLSSALFHSCVNSF